MPETLPHFRYHPDPVATGSVEISRIVCLACGKARGYIYTGPVYSQEELGNLICPWCIADGTAHKKFDAEFTDIASVGGYSGEWDEIPEGIAEEVVYRTPGILSWQQGKWFTHCNDAAAFLGIVGSKELRELGPEAIEVIRDETGYDVEEWDYYFKLLTKDGSPSAYIFQCLHCGAYGGFSDSD